MKKDLSVTAKELFPNLEKNTYEKLICSYVTDGKTNINPGLTFDEAVSKYTAYVLNVMENKNNWKIRNNNMYIDFHNYLIIFEEFFPLYKSDKGFPYLDLGEQNYEIGEKIVLLLITKIFYLNYTGIDIRDIIFIREQPSEREIIRIFLRLSDME
jgi:hypothetical protein